MFAQLEVKTWQLIGYTAWSEFWFLLACGLSNCSKTKLRAVKAMNRRVLR